MTNRKAIFEFENFNIFEFEMRVRCGSL